MGTIKKDIFIGLIISLLATSAGIFLYLEYFSNYGFTDSLMYLKQGNLFGKLLSLAAVPNLFVFFIFLKKKQDQRAKGVLLGTILTAFLTLVLKFL